VKGVLDRLAVDLRAEFTGRRGFLRGNLHAFFAQAWRDGLGNSPTACRPILPWGHAVAVLERVDDRGTREFYSAGWGREQRLEPSGLGAPRYDRPPPEGGPDRNVPGRVSHRLLSRVWRERWLPPLTSRSQPESSAERRDVSAEPQGPGLRR